MPILFLPHFPGWLDAALWLLAQRMFLYTFTKKALYSSPEPDLVSQTQTGFMDKFYLLSLFVLDIYSKSWNCTCFSELETQAQEICDPVPLRPPRAASAVHLHVISETAALG